MFQGKLVMAASVRQQLVERALTAEKLLEQLSPCLIKLKEATAAKLCAKEVEELKLSNAKLRADVEQLVQRLRRAEEINGVKQVYCSTPTSSPATPNGPSSTAESSVNIPAEKTNQSNTKPEKPQQKKVKPKKEQKAPVKADEVPADISRVLLKVGRIVDVKLHPDADTLYVETVDLAEDRPRTILSGLAGRVPMEQMRDRLALFACNLKPAKMRGILSEGMIICASSESKIQIVEVPAGAVPGDIVTFSDYPGEPDKQLNPKKKIWEAVAPDLKTDENGVATYKGCPFTIADKGICKAPGCPNFPIK